MPVDFNQLKDRAGSFLGDVGEKIKKNPEYVTTPGGAAIAHLLGAGAGGVALGAAGGYGAGKVLGSAINQEPIGPAPDKVLSDMGGRSDLNPLIDSTIDTGAGIMGDAAKGVANQTLQHPIIATILAILLFKSKGGRAVGRGLRGAAGGAMDLGKNILKRKPNLHVAPPKVP